jgi:hypothetical protein
MIGLTFSRHKQQGEPSVPPPVAPNLSPQEAEHLIAFARVQIRKKAYQAAQATLNSVLHQTSAASPQSSEAADVLKKIAPLAARQAQQEQQAEQSQWELRNIARATMQDGLLRMGYDVQVGNVVPSGSKDNRNLLILGASVNRVFVYNLVTADLRSRLRRLGFTKITFMKSRWDWFAEYDVATNTFRGLN